MQRVLNAALLLLLAWPQLTMAAVYKEPWYAKTVSEFERASYIDAKNFAVAVPALRQEFVELTLKLLGGKVHIPFGEAVFDDVAVVSPLFPVFQEGARGQWVLGVKSCAGSHPCYAAPVKPVNRAEAAALIVRAFGLKPGPTAPGFTDNLPNQWYTGYITTAAGRCILQGDDPSLRSGQAGMTVRPGDSMNRAEMLAMLERAMQKLTYPGCALPAPPPLPQAQKEFTLIQSAMSIPGQSTSSSQATSFAPASSTSSMSSASFALSSVPFVPLMPSSSASSIASTNTSSARSAASSTLPAFNFPLLNSSSSISSSTSSATVQDPGYPDLLARFQQYITQFSNLIARARSAESAAALQLLNVMRTQIDLLNELYPYVVYAKSRPLSAGEWSVVLSLETNIRSGFAAAP